MRTERGLTMFFTAKDMFSNWYIRDFKVKGITFNCGEQYMMFAKAKLFGDEKIAQAILLEKDPKEQKALGRKVSGFVQSIWDEKCVPIMIAGLTQKFLQHKDMGDALVKTDGTLLVEASKFDKIWGCGLDEKNPLIFDKSKWPGLNLLGERVLTKVRSFLIERRLALDSPELG